MHASSASMLTLHSVSVMTLPVEVKAYCGEFAWFIFPKSDYVCQDLEVLPELKLRQSCVELLKQNITCDLKMQNFSHRFPWIPGYKLFEVDLNTLYKRQHRFNALTVWGIEFYTWNVVSVIDLLFNVTGTSKPPCPLPGVGFVARHMSPPAVPSRSPVSTRSWNSLVGCEFASPCAINHLEYV